MECQRWPSKYALALGISFLHSVTCWFYTHNFQFHPSSYSAFCRNYGDYTTAKVGYRCWNEEAIGSMRSDMFGLWDTFDADVDSFLNQISLSIEEVFRNGLRATDDIGKLSAVFPLY